MISLSRIPAYLWPALIGYLVVGVALWPVPLLNVLHAESSALVAGVAFFAAGLTAIRAFSDGYSLRRVVVAQEAALLVPWGLLTISAAWAPNCGYLLGLMFYALFPGVTVVLAVALAYMLTSVQTRRPSLVLALIGLLVIVLGPVYDLGFHPQFYTYNHVFGGVLGPIYDEELAIRGGLFWFRLLTLLWALMAVLVGRARRRRAAPHRGRGVGGFPRWRQRGAILAVAAAIATGYGFAAPLGLNTPAWYLQEQLGGHAQTEHFDLYFDAEVVAPDEVRRLALSHEYRYAWLSERLGVDVPDRIASYLYPSPEVKAQLTGARRTNVAPVWLPRPQSHVLLEHYERVFGHELVHVFSRQVGLPFINASVSVGLVEGLAEALEPPDGRPSLHEQVAAAALQRVGVRANDEQPLAAEVAARFSPFGFWTGRGAVSYTTMGSFVRYLLDRYGAERLRAVYAWADFDAVYGESLMELAREWEAFLYDLPVVARGAAPLARVRFSQPSLFEARCPHHVPSYRRYTERAERALAEADTAAAASLIAAALDAWPTYPSALSTWARLRLARGRPAPVITRLDTLEVVGDVPSLQVRLADAYALAGSPERARSWYLRARRSIPLYAFEARTQLILREAVADRPDVVQVLAGIDSASVKAQHLAKIGSGTPAVVAIEALLLAEAGQYGAAAPRLHRALGDMAAQVEPPEQRLLLQQRLVWLAGIAYLAGRVERAHAYAVAAATAYARAGALNQAEHMADVAGFMDWVLTRAEGDPLALHVIY